MSLILEALKKSEAERRLGQVPGLMTPVQRTAPRARSSLPMFAVVVLVLAGAGAAGWWWLQRSDAPDAAPVAATPPPSPAVEPATQAPPADTRVAAPPVATSSRSPKTPALPAPLPSDPDFDSTERESRPIAADTRALAPAPRDPPRPPATALPAPPEPITPPRTAPVATPTPAPAPAAATPSAAPDAASTAPASPAPAATSTAPTPAPAPAATPDEPLEYLPRLNDLTPGERDGLPALKLSMHVYAAAPDARFVIVDGQRLTEGARVSATVTVQEIRRDGAVLLIGERRVLLPRL